MMKVFLVMLHGDEVLLPRKDGALRCGFYVNEYVIASSETEAREKARKAIERRLTTDAGIQTTANTLATLRIEKIEPASWLSMFRREGFSLYPTESSS